MTLRKIAIYSGAGAKLAQITADSLVREVDQTAYTLCFIDASDVRKGTIFDEAALFVMPGGEDRPYRADLQGLGTENITGYARRGATLLFCAGMYFGARGIAFHKGLPDEMIADSGLGLFPGIVVSVDHDFAAPYDGKITSVFTPLIELATGDQLRIWCHGGGSFRPDPGHVFGPKNCKLMAMGRYAELAEKPVAIGRINYPEGGCVISSGVHFEISHHQAQTHFHATGIAQDHARILSALAESERQRRRLMRSALRQLKIGLAYRIPVSDPGLGLAIPKHQPPARPVMV